MNNVAIHNQWVIAEPISLVNVVVGNFLSNSIKFSNPNSEISFYIENKGSMVELVMEDHGVGIPESLLKNLFNFGEKTSRLGTNGERGTGFGMPLAKTYMDFFGGKVEVTSRCISEDPSNHGTKVRLIFKQAQDSYNTLKESA